MEEKAQMQGLNDRLVNYVDRVRQLELENNQLQQQVSTVEEHTSSEIITMRDSFGQELQSLRRALDTVSKEKAKLEIDADKFEKEARESRSNLKNKEKAYEAASKNERSLQNRLDKLQADFDTDKAELRDLRPEHAKLQKKLDDAKKNLEDETLKRIDLQNQLQSADEAGKFEKQLLEQQLNESKVRKVIEITEMDGKYKEEYESQLAKNIQELRDNYERDQKLHNEEMIRMYETKIKNLQSKLDDTRRSGAGTTHEIQELTTKIMSLESRNAELESSASALQKRLNDVLEEMEAERRGFRHRLAEKDGEIRSKEEAMEDMTKDYNALLEIKIGLDREIAMYNKILEGEESRLGLSPTGTPLSTPAGRGVKRKRTTIVEEDISELATEHSGKGNVVIEPLDKDGKFVQVKNVSEGQINIGGWTLTNTHDGKDVSYKFHRAINLEAGEVTTVWSSDSRETHEAPLNLVMKKGGWEIGEENVTTLTNKDGEEEALRNSRRQRSLSGSTRYGLSRVYSGGADADDASKCAIM